MYMTLPQPCWFWTGRDAVDHVAVPPDGVAGLDVGDAGERLHEQRVPGVAGGEDLVDGDAAHVVVGHVGQQRAQHEVGHGAGDRDGVQHALVVGHVGQGGPALEGAEGRAHRRAGVLRSGGAVGRVPGVVLLDGAVEQVAEGLLVSLGHPQVEGAGVEVGAEAGRVGALRAAADAVRVQRVAVRVEPLHAVGLVLPLAVEERLDRAIRSLLAGLHLGRRPVDRVDLGPGADAAEEVVAWAAVVLEELVALDVVDDVAIPAQGLLAVEVAAHDEAAAPAQQRERLRGYRAGLDVGVVDDGPDRLAAFPRGGDLVDLGLICCSTTAKTSSTVRPEAAMRARSAALTCRMAAGRSAGVSSQCGSAGSGAVGQGRG